MSASQIPNLNTLRRGRGPGRFRGRGQGTAPNESRQESSAAKDKVVQQTDSDASVSRLSAVELGYLEDPFASALTANGPSSRRYPIINRGTFVRTTAIDELVSRFLNSGGSDGVRKQMISLGAGSDTRVFRLFSSEPKPNLVYHELDFAVNTATKIRAIRSNPLLQKALRITETGDATISPEGDALHSDSYHIHPVDLRSLSKSSDNPLVGVNNTLPTLIISECCLVYLSPTDAAEVLSYFTNTLFPSSSPSAAKTPLGLILYEPIRPHDRFGETMVSNLAARGIHLQTLHRYASLALQRKRLQDSGFDSGQDAADVDFIWERWVSEEEKERVAGLEMLDEVEEWKLLASHYCVAWGWREGGSGSELFGQWKAVEAQQNEMS
ncbi:carboxy methyl transferase for protein phosphatase 2A [Arachnomyces sp. PD_36]|nr:carboxy methyl transferase for protein phosphatase 2A [Arachnomyces sp. PD_36]